MKIKTLASGFNYTNMYASSFIDSYWIYLPDLSEKTLSKLKYIKIPTTKPVSKAIKILPSQIATLEIGWNHVSILWEGTYIESLADIKAYLEGLLGTLPEVVNNTDKHTYIRKCNETNISL